MKNLLNAVEITKTLRIKASSEIEAAKIALDGRSVDVSFVDGEESVFVGFESSEKENQFVNIVFVEEAAGGYRVEVGRVYVSKLELTFLLDREEETVVYCTEDRKEIITEEEMAHKLNHWFDFDTESGERGRMFNHVVDQFQKNTLKNGEFTEVS